MWAWLIQIGHGRGGLYSYEALENLVGCDLHGAEHLVEELQHPRAGELIAMGPEGFPCYRIAVTDPPDVLVLQGVDARSRRPDRAPAAGGGGVSSTTASWQWVLHPLDGGRWTRLLARQRISYPRRHALLWSLVSPTSFVMERRMLLGIKERAERGSRQ